MDLVTGAHVAVAVTVPVPRGRMWDLITDVERIGQWSPETVGAAWHDGAGPRPGDRFTGRNRYADGTVINVSCVITEAEQPSRFAWDVLDDAGRPGSSWRYELRDGAEPGTTVVNHSFTHGPGDTGVRDGARIDPGTVHRRLATLCGHMTSTIAAMAGAANTMGAAR